MRNREELQGVDAALWIVEKPSKPRAMKNKRERKHAEHWEHFKCQRAGEGGASVPGGEAPVRLNQGALPRLGKEHGADPDAVRAIESVDGAATVGASDRVTPPGLLGSPSKAAGNGRILINSSPTERPTGKLRPQDALIRPSLGRPHASMLKSRFQDELTSISFNLF